MFCKSNVDCNKCCWLIKDYQWLYFLEFVLWINPWPSNWVIQSSSSQKIMWSIWDFFLSTIVQLKFSRATLQSFACRRLKHWFDNCCLPFNNENLHPLRLREKWVLRGGLLVITFYKSYRNEYYRKCKGGSQIIVMERAGMGRKDDCQAFFPSNRIFPEFLKIIASLSIQFFPYYFPEI